MTLIVAGVAKDSIWMVGDTAITGGDIALRAREFLPKIEVGVNFPALVAFAGGVEYGTIYARRAANAKTARDALAILMSGSEEGGFEFAYATFEFGKPKLYNIIAGSCTESLAVNIGSADAFETFQKIRHGQADPYAPNAFKSFLCGSDIAIPKELSTAAQAMLDTFSSRSDHDVGGWAVPYLLQADGAHFCSYAYSVSDPNFDKLIPGSLLNHGSSAGGGATLSVTALPNNEGMVVYWLQLPGGLVMFRSREEYEKFECRGSPSEFKSIIREKLSYDVHLWVGDHSVNQPHTVRVIRNKDGKIDFTVAEHGKILTFAMHNLEADFVHAFDISLNDAHSANIPKNIHVEKISDKRVGIAVDGKTVDLNSKDLDMLISKLSDIRANLEPAVSLDIEHSSMMTQIDPAWRTYENIHPSLVGVSLNLRHSGYGWVGFILPYLEALNLGHWLLSSALRHLPMPQGGDQNDADSENSLHTASQNQESFLQEK